MFLFKVLLFQGCKSETEPISTKSVVKHVTRYQVLFEAYYKNDTKYCCCRATCLSGHIVDFTTHASTVCIRYQVLLAVYYKADTKYCCCRATCLSGHIVDFTTHINRMYTIPSTVGGILQIRYQVLLLSYNMFVRLHCRLHYTRINSLYTIPSIVGGILQIRYQVLLLPCNMFVRSHCRLHYTHISHLYTIPSIVGGILQIVLNLIQCVKVLRGV
jgi:hypothetical protein